MAQCTGNVTSDSTRSQRDRMNGLHGIHDIRLFRTEIGHISTEPDETFLLQHVSWNIRDEPSEAEDWTDWTEDDGDKPQPKLDLSKKLFDGPILLTLESRYGDRDYLVPVFGGTICDVLSVIHNFYRMYESTHVDKEDENDMDVNYKDFTYSMGDGVWFEGLRYDSPGLWSVYLES